LIRITLEGGRQSALRGAFLQGDTALVGAGAAGTIERFPLSSVLVIEERSLHKGKTLGLLFFVVVGPFLLLLPSAGNR